MGENGDLIFNKELAVHNFHWTENNILLNTQSPVLAHVRVLQSGSAADGSYLLAVDDGDKRSLVVWEWRSRRQIARTAVSRCASFYHSPSTSTAAGRVEAALDTGSDGKQENMSAPSEDMICGRLLSCQAC